MRTTMNLDDDVLRAVKSIADARHVSLGRAVSDLIRKALASPPRIADRNGFPVFDVGPDAAPITLEDVQRDQDEA